MSGLSIALFRRRRRAKDARSQAKGTAKDAAPGTEGTVNISGSDDLHYACALLLCRKTGDGGIVGLMFITFLTVGLQMFAAATLLKTTGNLHGFCTAHTECGRGMFCTTAFHPRAPALGSIPEFLGAFGRRLSEEDADGEFGNAGNVSMAAGVCARCEFSSLFCNVDGTPVTTTTVKGMTGRLIGATMSFDLSLNPEKFADGSCDDFIDPEDVSSGRFQCQWPIVNVSFARHVGLSSEYATGADVAAMCSACVDRGQFREHGYVQKYNIAVLGAHGWIVFIISAIVAIGAVTEEVRAMIKSILVIAANDYSAPSESGVSGTITPLPTTASGKASAEPGFVEAVPPAPDARVEAVAAAVRRGEGYGEVTVQAFLLLQAMRSVMLCLVLACVPVFVLQDQADAVSIALNTVATLFILELDNIVCSLVLGEVLCEEAAAAPLTLARGDARRALLAERPVVLFALFGALAMPLGAIFGMYYYMFFACLVGGSCFLSEAALWTSWRLRALAFVRHLVAWIFFFTFLLFFLYLNGGTPPIVPPEMF